MRMLRLTVFPKRLLNPPMNKLILIHAPPCPLPQPPLDLLMCLRRFPFLHRILDIFIDTFYRLYFCLFFGFLFWLTDFQVDLYLFFISIVFHTLILCFSSESSSCFISFHRYLPTLLRHCFLHSVGSNFIPFLSTFCCFIYTYIVLLCYVRLVP